jgi:formate hydrogenlyase subunit 3/multisubunit Na+/H+ antiporter MnhD subunit
MNGLLNAADKIAASWAEYFEHIGLDSSVAKTAMNIVSYVLWIALAAVGVAGIIYSIYLGVKLAAAEDQGKRDEAKKHLITVIIAIVVTLVLVVFFNTLLPMILDAFRGSNTTPDTFIGL